MVRFVEDRPTLLERRPARTVFDTLPSEALRDALFARADELAAAGADDFIARATTLVDLAKGRADVLDPLGRHLLALRPSLADKNAGREAKALLEKVGARIAKPD